MTPRTYTLGKRARQVAKTRARIVEAAAELYQEKGVASTSMQEVARRADVAPATVLNHFPSPDELAEAVVTQLLTTLRAPSEEMFAGLETLRERITRLSRELAGFYQRSEPWFRVHQREVAKVRAFAEGAQHYYERLDRLLRQALGPLADDERVLTAVWSFMSPPVFGAMRARRMSAEEAADTVSEVLVPWLERQQG